MSYNTGLICASVIKTFDQLAPCAKFHPISDRMNSATNSKFRLGCSEPKPAGKVTLVGLGAGAAVMLAPAGAAIVPNAALVELEARGVSP